MKFLTEIDEGKRGWLYFVAAVVLGLLLVGLLIYDVLVDGGSAADWVFYILGGLGFGGNLLATANTKRSPLRKSNEVTSEEAGDQF